MDFQNFRKEAENPARIPPQTPPAGGKSAEAGRILSPRQIVSPCRVRFNHLDFARNSFELCPTNTASFCGTLSNSLEDWVVEQRGCYTPVRSVRAGHEPNPLM